MSQIFYNPSPRWGWTTKLVVALTLVAATAFLVLRFENLIGPLIVAFILAYLLHPVASRLMRGVKLPWRFAVTLIYLLLIILLLGLLTLGGLALFDQLQSLIGFIQEALKSLPDFLNTLSHQRFTILLFEFDFSKLDLSSFTNQALSSIQPLLTQLGSLVGSIASSLVGVLGMVGFILLISYFMLVETEGLPNRLLNVNVPGYEADMSRFGSELSRIWNTFLRGQLIVITITIVLYALLLMVLGLRYSLGLALLAGLARFVPYVGPAIAWTTYGLVALFQGGNPYGLTPLGYVAVIIGVALITDSILDNYIAPRILASALKVHPAAVMVAALMGAGLLGLVGVILAAPVMASIKLFTTYAVRKLFDQDPWENLEEGVPLPNRVPLHVQARMAWQKLSAKVASLKERKTP